MRSVITRLAVAAMSLAASAVYAGAEMQGVTDDKILVGSTQPLSGPVASWGVPTANGLRLAIDDINAAGGVHGRKIEIIIEDDQYDPRKTLQAADKLMNLDKVFVLVHSFGTAQNMALKPIAEEAGMPLVFPSTGEPKVWEPTSDLFWGFYFPNRNQGRLMMRYLVKDKGYSKIGVIYQDDDLGKSYLEGIHAEAEALGVKTVEELGIQRNLIDTSSQVSRLKAAGAEAIIVATVIPPAVSIAKERAKLNWDVDLFLTQAAYSDTFVDLAGDAAQGVHAVSQVQIPYPEVSPEVAAWNDRYQKKYGQKADLGALYGYQAMLMFRFGLENAGRDLTRQTLADGLEKMKDYTDLFQTVPYTLSADDHLVAHGVYFYQVEAGRWKRISDYFPL